MLVKKFDIQFKKIEAGWLYFIIKANNKIILSVSASGVYNPFYEYVEILYNLKHNRFKEYSFYIDQEGYDAKIKFTQRNKYIYIEFETQCSSCKNKLPKFEGYFKKREVIYKMKMELLNFYRKHKKEMNDDFYPFTFDYSKLIRI